MPVRRLEIGSFGGVKSLNWRHVAGTAALAGRSKAGPSTVLDRTLALNDVRDMS